MRRSLETGLSYDTPIKEIPVPVGMDTESFRDLFQKFRNLGYSDGVIERIIRFRLRRYGFGAQSFTNFQRKYFDSQWSENAPGSAILLYRGINSLRYFPTFSAGTFVSTGYKWASSDLSEAIGFADEPIARGLALGGYVVELEVPEFALNYWSWDRPGRTKISLNEIPDDRVFMSRLGRLRPEGVQWYTYDQAVKNGLIQRLPLAPARRRRD